MEKIERFVIEENVSRFMARLESEQELERRCVLSYVLLQEENKFAKLSCELDQLDDYLSRCDFHIVRGESLLDGCRDTPQQRTMREFLQNMKRVRHTLHAVRARQLKAIDRLDGP